MPADAARSVLDVYQRHGAAWAAQRDDRLIEGPWLDRFCALLPRCAAVLDIGCGSGVPLARDLIRRGFAVTGVDGSATMLALFAHNVPDAATHRCDMRRLALGRRYDGLLAWDSFFHLPPDDQRAMFPRFAAHAAPGAPLMFTSGPVEGETIGTLEGSALYHASLGPSEYRALLSANGFVVVGHAAEDPGCGRHTVWLAAKRG